MSHSTNFPFYICFILSIVFRRNVVHRGPIYKNGRVHYALIGLNPLTRLVGSLADLGSVSVLNEIIPASY